MSLGISRFWTIFLPLIFVFAAGPIASGQAQAQASDAAQPQAVSQTQSPEKERKIKTKVAPVYPELAKKMNVSGAVKIQIIVSPNGSVKSTKIVGGHPLLIDSAVEAIKKWKYEPAAAETTQLVEFHFTNGQ